MKNKFGAVALSTIFAALSIVSFPAHSLAEQTSKTVSTPVAVFEKYHDVFVNAKTYEAVLPFMCAKVVKEMTETPPEERKMMFGLIQSMAPKKVNVIGTKIEGDVAILSLKIVIPAGKGEDKGIFGNSMREETTGEVRMVVEKGDWKVEKEKWNTKMTSDETSAPTASADPSAPAVTPEVSSETPAAPSPESNSKP